MSILHNIFFFIVAIGVLVTFHEYGHYWVARKLGVKVLRFSVGFGKPLFSWRRKSDADRVEYVVAAIPLGGYVKMLDEREGNVADEELHRAFNRQSVAKRSLIVFAGPAFNFILAVFLYWLVFVIGTTAQRPLLGEPMAGSVAEQAGFSNRDEIIQVGESDVASWNTFRIALIDQGLDGGQLDIKVRDIDGFESTRSLQLGETRLLEDETDIVTKLGFEMWQPDLPPQIGGVVEDGAASRAGLKQGDTILSINDLSISEWSEIVEAVRQNPARSLKFIVGRDGVQIDLIVVPDSRERDDEVIGYIGAYQSIPDEVRDEMIVELKYGYIESIPKAIVKTWDMSLLTLRVLWKMVTGEASLNNISGPITIAQYAGITATIGFTTFIGFLAIISVSLGVINLLPIPMLDGGHLFYYLIETIKGGPVSETFEARGQQIGVMILALLMMIALFNDFQRLLQ
ncbi:MAG: RIP metalloprotease RseP [Thiotrichales bacterium]|nr:MAG: RIP metalloprotease RseP [Thiotrichales bacterium]